LIVRAGEPDYHIVIALISRPATKFFRVQFPDAKTLNFGTPQAYTPDP